MKANIKKWINKANQAGFINVQEVRTGCVVDYFIDCSGFAWTRMNDKDFQTLRAMCPSIVVNKL